MLPSRRTGMLLVATMVIVVTTAVIVQLHQPDSALPVLKATSASQSVDTTLPPTSTTALATTTTSTTQPATTTTARPTTTLPRPTTTAAASPPTTAAAVTTTVASQIVPVCRSILVDISDQTLTAECSDGTYSMPISSGGDYWYTNPKTGVREQAVTPRGGPYKVYRKFDGTEVAPLGELYKPMYFLAGYAIHGGDLPGYAASHGCIRISYGQADWLFARVQKDVTEVTVQD